MRRLAIFSTFLAVSTVSCSSAQLQRTANAALITEKSAAGGLKAIDRWAGSEKERCTALNLQTEAERADCIGNALKAVKVGTEVGEKVALALDTFWDVWAVLKAKSENGKLTAEDWARLSGAMTEVLAQFDALRPHLEQIEGK